MSANKQLRRCPDCWELRDMHPNQDTCDTCEHIRRMLEVDEIREREHAQQVQAQTERMERMRAYAPDRDDPWQQLDDAFNYLQNHPTEPLAHLWEYMQAHGWTVRRL